MNDPIANSLAMAPALSEPDPRDQLFRSPESADPTDETGENSDENSVNQGIAHHGVLAQEAQEARRRSSGQSEEREGRAAALQPLG